MRRFGRGMEGSASTSGGCRARVAPPRAEKRNAPLERSKFTGPDFDEPFDPFGERVYNPNDFWDASNYGEPDDTKPAAANQNQSWEGRRGPPHGGAVPGMARPRGSIPPLVPVRQ